MAQRFDVVAIDYRGYGVSTGRPTESGLYRDVDATIAFVRDRLPHVNAPLVYWGRSLGTPMAAYAASREAPAGVVLEAGFPNVRGVLESNPVLWTLSWFSTYRFATADWMAACGVRRWSFTGIATASSRIASASGSSRRSANRRRS